VLYDVLGIVEPISIGQSARDYMVKSINPTLLKALTELCKQKPLDPVVNIVAYCFSSEMFHICINHICINQHLCCIQYL